MTKKRQKNKNIKKAVQKVKTKKSKTQEEREMDNKIDEAMSKIVEDTIPEEVREQEQQAHEAKRKTKKGLKITAALVGVFLLALVCAYGGMTYYYTDKLFPSTYINNIDCGKMTEEQAENEIRKQVEEYAIEIAFRGDKTDTIQGKDIDYTYVSTGEVGEILKEQKPWQWIAGYFNKTTHKIGHSVEYDAGLLREQLEALPSMQADQQEAPTDAHITFAETEFVIVDETEGNTVNEDVLLPKLEEAVSASQKTLSAEEADAYVHPAVYRDNEQLKEELEVLNTHAKASITYVFGDKKEVLDGMTIKDWITYDEEGQPVDDPKGLKEHVTQYVKELAEKYDTVGKERQIKNSSTGEMIAVSGGSYGWKINQKKEIAQLLEEIEAGEIIEREPVFSSEGLTWDEDDIGDTYVEINMTAQHVWYYKDGNLIMDTDCVTGNMSYKDRITPAGIYTLVYKQRDRVLRGRQQPDGSYEYESPVSYWMPFNGGIGLHDASWRGSFGGTIYKTNGSHGCINLPKSKAEILYDNIEKGTIIICYYE